MSVVVELWMSREIADSLVKGLYVDVSVMLLKVESRSEADRIDSASTLVHALSLEHAD